MTTLPAVITLSTSKQLGKYRIDSVLSEMNSAVSRSTPIVHTKMEMLQLSDARRRYLHTELLRHIGPVAPTFLKRSIGSSRSIAELFEKLSSAIPNDGEARMFLSGVERFFQVND